MNQNRKILIGLVGQPSSGKDTVASYLVTKYSFVHVSTGDLVRFYIAEHNLGEANRGKLREVAIKLREDNGADYLARLALKNEASHLVVSGLRAIAEAKVIKEAGGKLIACSAPIEIRFRRANERGRVGDDITFEKFKTQEEVEAANPDPEAQNVSAVIAMADYTIENSNDLEKLYGDIDTLLQNKLGLKT